MSLQSNLLFTLFIAAALIQSTGCSNIAANMKGGVVEQSTQSLTSTPTKQFSIHTNASKWKVRQALANAIKENSRHQENLKVYQHQDSLRAEYTNKEGKRKSTTTFLIPLSIENSGSNQIISVPTASHATEQIGVRTSFTRIDPVASIDQLNTDLAQAIQTMNPSPVHGEIGRSHTLVSNHYPTGVKHRLQALGCKPLKPCTVGKTEVIFRIAAEGLRNTRVNANLSSEVTDRFNGHSDRQAINREFDQMIQKIQQILR